MTREQYHKKIDNFITQFAGASLDYDGLYGAQCKDVFSEFNCDWLDLPYLYGNACDLWTNNDVLKYYDRITNTPTFIPQKGDWAIWSSSVGGGAGHVGVCTGEADVNRFNSFDQNWPTGSVCRIVGHNYINVLGYLRPKNLTEGLQMFGELINENGAIWFCVDGKKMLLGDPNIIPWEKVRAGASFGVEMIPITQQKVIVQEKIKEVPVEIPINITTEEEKQTFIAEYEKTHPPVVQYVVRDMTLGEALSILWKTIKNIKLKGTE